MGVFLVVGDASNVLQLRILPTNETKLFQLIMNGEIQNRQAIQGQMAKMAKLCIKSTWRV
jgi:hypothetical protein